MKEKDVWAKLKKMPGVLLERVETKIAGFPDVLFVFNSDGLTGLIELKRLPKWPTSVGTDFGLRPEQAVFLHRVCRNSGKAFIMVSADDEYLLFRGIDSLRIRQKLTMSEAHSIAIYRSDSICFEELEKSIRRG